MKTLIGLSLAALFAITEADTAIAQDTTNVAYTTKTKTKPNGKTKHKVIPYEPVAPDYGYPRDIDVFHYNSFYGYRPDYGLYPGYGYPWQPGFYPNGQMIDNRYGPYNNGYYYRR